MKKRYQVVMVIMILLLITQYLNVRKENTHDTENYIRMSYSRQWRILHSNIQQLESLIEVNVAAKEYRNNSEIIKSIIREISHINNSIINYSRLNEEYMVSVYAIVDLLEPIEEKVDRDKKLTEEDLLIVKEIIKLNDKYSAIKDPDLYKKSSSIFENMNLPTEVINYETELENLVQELDLQ
jgi:Arc/MetJ-type ribon-helix-helix transcriptional regulator